MPSGLASGPKYRSVKGGSKQRMAPDFIVTFSLAAADITGANSGKFVWVAPANAILLDVTEIHTTAGGAGQLARIKKVKAGTVGAAGAAADANHVNISNNIPLDVAANTHQTVAPASDNLIDAGDKIAVASAAGATGLAGGVVVLRLAWR